MKTTRTLCPRDSAERILTFWADMTERKNPEAQLNQARKMEALGQLSGDIAHSLNELLTVIYSFTCIIEMKAGAESFLGPYLNRITLATERASSITKGLLTFGGKRAMCFRPLDLDEIIAKAGPLMTRLIPEEISLTLYRSQVPLTVMADDTWLVQVLMNLTANARDAMPRGGSIIVSSSPFVMDRHFMERHGYGKPGSYALITFCDTGCGMDDTTQEKIFEPLFTTKETGKDVGLGLANVYGIVRQLEGFIEVFSVPGTGTVIKIYLPRYEQESVPEKTNLLSAPICGGSETVLLAEDEPMTRDLEESLLLEAGYTVITANDGAVALEKFKERGGSIDLLLVDAIMPRKNGLEVLRKAMEMRPEVAIIMMSDYAPEVMAMEDFLRRGVKVIRKPVNNSELLATVREVLDRRSLTLKYHVEGLSDNLP